jgi:3-dehydroquinate synthase
MHSDYNYQMKIHSITVTYLGGSYPIFIGENLLKEGALIRQHLAGHRALIVTNEIVAENYLALLQKSLEGVSHDIIILPDGEQYKNVDAITKIIDVLAEKQHHRDTTVIALGGGVVGDMAGFAAACFHRGVAFIQIPTTLLAQVDSSIGGKTGVNHIMGKNLIGAFHPPRAVFIDTHTLNTLPEREFNAGLSEIIKAALIKNAAFFEWLIENSEALQKRDKEVLMIAIQRACSIKANIVAEDEKEMGVRALLNFGHTFGHAIENALYYGTWLHGEAVAMGMVMACELSVRVGWLDAASRDQVTALLKKIGLPTSLPREMTRKFCKIS